MPDAKRRPRYVRASGSGSRDSQDLFGDFDGRAWLNTAHQGPLPLAAAEVAHDAVDRKCAPYRMAPDDFFDVPSRLRSALANLIGADPIEIALGTSTSFGLNLLAQGLRLQRGDEVLLVENDFPATVFPWLPLRRHGVSMRFLPAPDGVPNPAELRAALTDRTRVFCSSWVFSYTGFAADVASLARVCHEHGIRFVLNGSQAVGARPTDVRDLGVDAIVSCGYKWLCGPYATGFCWLRRDLLEHLAHEQAYEQGYWLANSRSHDLSRPPSYELRDDLGAAAYDVFCTANLFTFPAWIRAIELMLDRGIDVIAAHDQRLVQRFIDGVPDGWQLMSPAGGASRSTLAMVAPSDDADGGAVDKAVEKAFERLTEAGVDVAQRAGQIRISPHWHNSDDDIDRALLALR